MALWKLGHYAAVFGSKYPASMPVYDPNSGALYATWMGGNDYRNRSAIYGAYPPFYLKRMAALFPDVDGVLHLFSGGLTGTHVRDQWALGRSSGAVHVRVDNGLHPEARKAEPDVMVAADDLTAVFDKYGRFQLLLADPPYEKLDEERYRKEALAAREAAARLGAKDAPLAAYLQPLNKREVIEGCSEVLFSGGILAWMDTSLPMWSKKLWIWRGGITILRSTNHRVRFVTLLEKR